MASLEKQKGRFRIVFRYGGQKYQRALDTDSEKEALGAKNRVEENLKLLERGRLHYEPGDDLVLLLLSDGKLNAKPEITRRVTLGEFFDQYKANRPPSKEGSTAYTEDIHIEHLLRLLGSGTALQDIPKRLQEYINQRSSEAGRKGKVSHVTIKKELGTLSSLWNRWGTANGLVPGPLTLKNLEHAKRYEKPPFQTWEQIERKIALGADDDLWDSLFLTLSQVKELLVHVDQRGSIIRGHIRRFAFIHPMFAFAAYTGARRSELLRSRREDIDFESRTVTIREKKKDRTKKETYRQVPLTPFLFDVLKQWFAVHPGGEFTFCSTAGEEMTEQMANHHFRWAVEGSMWSVIRGWHCLRHSFVSLLAAHGVDERVIMKLVGHLNPETTKRYSHLFPSTVHAAMDLVFGSGQLAIAEPQEVSVGDEPTAAVG
jgi:integrase